MALLFVAALALYVRTVAPGLLDGDEGEFQINVYRLGVSHTGYPLFFLLGKLFTLLVPVGTIATRANLFSAFWGALTIAAAYLIIWILTCNRWAAVVTALLLAASRVEWSQSVIPRPYTLNSLFVVAVPLLLFLWRLGKVDLTVVAFVFGLSLTNHRTIMWFGPAIALFVLLADYHVVLRDFRLKGNVVANGRAWLAHSELLRPRRLIALAIAFVAPLLLYGYIFWRGESDVGVEFHWKDFNAEIMGGYVSASWRFGPLDWLVSRVTELYIPMLIEQFTVPGFVAGLIGMAALLLDKPPRGWNAKLPPREVFLFILLSNLINAAFCVIFWVIDIDKFFLPCFITFLFFIGVGLAVVWDGVKSTVASRRSTDQANQSLVASRQSTDQANQSPVASRQSTDRREQSPVISDQSSVISNRSTVDSRASLRGLVRRLSTVYCRLITDHWSLITVYRLFLLALFTAAIGFLLTRNLPLNDWSGRTEVARTWDENLALPLEDKAVIAGSWESITPLEYAMYVDGKRRDLDRWKLLVKNYQLGQVPYGSRQADIEKAVQDGRPVYLTVYPGETETLGALVDEFRLAKIGDLWRVLDAPPRDDEALAQLRSAQPMTALSDRDGNTLELLGYAIHPSPALQAGEFGLATLFWRLPRSLGAHLSVSLRLTDAQGHLISQRDSEPAGGLRPTNGWAPNEVVQDDVGFIIPPDAPAGEYHLSLVVYNMATGENWKNDRGATLVLNDLSVTRTLEPPPVQELNIPHRLDVPLPPLRLRGYAIGNASPKGGDVLDLSLWWQLDQPTVHGETISIALRDPGGRVTALYSGAPVEGFPASEWGRAAIVRARYSLPLPLDVSGSAHVIVQSLDKSTELPIDIQPSGRTFAAPHPEYAQTAQIGDAIKLLGYDLDKTQARPGETVRLTVYWQALKTPAASYTVFAHLLDAGGVLRGQQDALPRGGALPTERWLPGEVVSDAYDIPVAADAPPGDYSFELGMYLPETGDRLPAIDAAGSRLQDDRVLLGRLRVQK